VSLTGGAGVSESVSLTTFTAVIQLIPACYFLDAFPHVSSLTWTLLFQIVLSSLAKIA